MGFSRQEYWSGVPLPSPKPRIKSFNSIVSSGLHFFMKAHVKLVLQVKVLVFQSCPTLCNPMDYSLPGSSVYGILQARILEWVAVLFSKGSSHSRDIEPGSPALQADSLPSEPPGKLQKLLLKKFTDFSSVNLSLSI